VRYANDRQWEYRGREDDGETHPVLRGSVGVGVDVEDDRDGPESAREVNMSDRTKRRRRGGTHPESARLK
jgi:hypothetical protein